MTDEQWLEIGEKMVHGLGYTSNMWLMIKHKPTERQLKLNPDAQPHVHLMIHTFECESGKFNRVNDWRDKTRAGKLTREIEKEYNLYQVPPSKEAQYKRPSKGQYRRYLREQKETLSQKIDQPEPIVLEQLQSICTEALSQRKDLVSYIFHLERKGVNVLLATKNGQPVGISYKLDGIPFAGSKLGKQFSWTELKKRDKGYDLSDPAIRHYFCQEIDQPKNISPRTYTQQQIEEAAADQPSLKVFIGRLQAQDISIKFKVTRNKVIQGVRYGYMGEEWRGSELTNASLPKLQKVQGIDFNKKRDLALIESVNAGQIIELTSEEQTTKAVKEQNELTKQFAEIAAKVFAHESLEKQTVKGNICGTITEDYCLIYEPKQQTFSVHNQERGEILTVEIDNNQSTIVDSHVTTQDVKLFQAVLDELNHQAREKTKAKALALAKQEAEALARQEAEALAKQEAEDLARQEALDLAKQEAEALAQQKALARQLYPIAAEIFQEISNEYDTSYFHIENYLLLIDRGDFFIFDQQKNSEILVVQMPQSYLDNAVLIRSNLTGEDLIFFQDELASLQAQKEEELASLQAQKEKELANQSLMKQNQLEL